MSGLFAGWTLVDVVLLIVLAAAFFVGYAQGAIRQLLGIGAFIVSFILAANLRGPVGSWLSQYWTQYPVELSGMAAFGLSLLVLLGVTNLGITVYYKRMPLFPQAAAADELLGGVLALCLALLLLAALLIVLDSYYTYRSVVVSGADVPWLHDIDRALGDSAIANFLRQGFVPGLLAIFGPFVPAAIHAAPY